MEADPEHFEAALVRRRRIRIAALATVGVVAAAAFIYVLARDRAERNALAERDRAAAARRGPQPIDAAEVQALRDAVTRRHATLSELDATFRAAVAATKTTPPTSTERCPIDVVTAETSPTQPEARWVSVYPFLEVGPDDAPQSVLWQEAQRDLLQAREVIESGRRPPRDIEQIGAPTERRRYALVFRATDRKAPTRVATSFVPGTVEGVALLWDHVEARFACAAPITARSSERVLARVVGDVPADVITSNPYATHNAESVALALEDDLRDQELRAIAEGLRVVR